MSSALLHCSHPACSDCLGCPHGLCVCVRVCVCVRICVQRLTLEARQQDIRDKQLVVQQSGEYVEKLKVRLWACLSWEERIKHVQCGL